MFCFATCFVEYVFVSFSNMLEEYESDKHSSTHARVPAHTHAHAVDSIFYRNLCWTSLEFKIRICLFSFLWLNEHNFPVSFWWRSCLLAPPPNVSMTACQRFTKTSEKGEVAALHSLGLAVRTIPQDVLLSSPEHVQTLLWRQPTSARTCTHARTHTHTRAHSPVIISQTFQFVHTAHFRVNGRDTNNLYGIVWIFQQEFQLSHFLKIYNN